METLTQETKLLQNNTFTIYFGEGGLNSTLGNSNNGNSRSPIILLIQSTTASIGIVSNLTVIVVFLNHKKFRRKIPNILIINQVKTITKCLMGIVSVTP